MLTLADTIEALMDIRPALATQVITDVVTDLERVIPGSLLIALSADPSETASMVRSAFSKGAILAIVECPLPEDFQVINTGEPFRWDELTNQDLPICFFVERCLLALQKLAWFWRGRNPVRVIGITGSVGKTTTKDLAHEVLSQRYRTLKNSGRPACEIEVPLALLSLTDGDQRAIMEYSLESLGTGSLLDELITAQTVVLTNISATMVSNPDKQIVLDSVQKWFHNIPVDNVVILNFDDPGTRDIAKSIQAGVFFYGLDPRADLWADEVEGLGLEGIHFQLHYENESFALRVPLIGRYSVHTALRAAAIGIVEGLSWDEIFFGLRFGNIQLRLAAVQSRHGAMLLDDTYNASTDSMLAALNLLDEMEGRKIAVLAGMPDLGGYERMGHEMVGLRASQVVDHLITVGELGQMIAAAARTAWMPARSITEVADNKGAVQVLESLLQPGDVVLVKGPRRFQMEKITEALESQR